MLPRACLFDPLGGTRVNEFDPNEQVAWPPEGPWKVMVLANTPTVLPGTCVELRWDIEDNIGLLRRRRLPHPPSLIVTVRNLPAMDVAGTVQPRPAIGVCPVPSSPLLTPGGQWRTQNNEPRTGRQAGAS